VKITIVTDIHHAPPFHTKKPAWDVLPVLADAVAQAEQRGADLILDLGDHISDTTHDNDVRCASEVAAVFRQTSTPKAHLLGNHDVVTLSLAENAAIFGSPMASRVVDLGEARVVVWQPGVRVLEATGFAPVATELPWLIDTLLADPRPAIIASHVPLSGQSQIGNTYFEHRPWLATYPDQAVVLEAVEATGRGALWLAGHVHWNTVTQLRGIIHVTIQSMSEQLPTMAEPAGVYVDLDIADGAVSIAFRGLDPLVVQLPFQPSGGR
jgi:Icc protein